MSACIISQALPGLSSSRTAAVDCPNQIAKSLVGFSSSHAASISLVAKRNLSRLTASSQCSRFDTNRTSATQGQAECSGRNLWISQEQSSLCSFLERTFLHPHLSLGPPRRHRRRRGLLLAINGLRNNGSPLYNNNQEQQLYISPFTATRPKSSGLCQANEQSTTEWICQAAESNGGSTSTSSSSPGLAKDEEKPPNNRDSPPVRDTGIASEKEWNINLRNQPTNESGLNDDGSTWYRESGEDLGDNGYRCRWVMMGGRTYDGAVEWKETWWEKSDWTGYKELGAEKSGRNAQGDSWWETWQEIFRQDEWSGLARIEKSAHKQAKSRSDGIWNEKWWEKYNAKGWTEKGAHKYGRLKEQSWWEKWGEQYDGRGAVLKWTDKWAETDVGTKWGDKWEERFSAGIGSKQGETWHVSSGGERWSRTWGEEHFGSGKVHKYGKSTSGELWDAVVEEATYYEAEPHYGWGEAVANSLQLLSIEIREKPASGSPPPSPPPSPSSFSPQLPQAPPSSFSPELPQDPNSNGR